MKFEGTGSLQASCPDVWAALHELRVLRHAIPGLKTIEEIGPGQYAVTISAGVGAVKGTYAGRFALADDEPGRRCTVEASARGAAGAVTATASVVLDGDRPAGTAVSYQVEAQVVGPLAGVGQRMIGAAIKRTTVEFLHGVEREITNPTREPTPGPVAIVGTDGHAPRAAGLAPPGAPPTSRSLILSALAGGALVLAGLASGEALRRRRGNA